MEKSQTVADRKAGCISETAHLKSMENTEENEKVTMNAEYGIPLSQKSSIYLTSFIFPLLLFYDLRLTSFEGAVFWHHKGNHGVASAHSALVFLTDSFSDFPFHANANAMWWVFDAIGPDDFVELGVNSIIARAEHLLGVVSEGFAGSRRSFLMCNVGHLT